MVCVGGSGSGDVERFVKRGEMSFLRDYCEYTAGNEVPTTFHTWAGLSTLASAASRKIWIDQGIFTLYPNMYILLVADPGVRKSTAMNLGLDLVQDVGDIAIAPASVTKEALTQWMGDPKSPCRQVFTHEGEDISYVHVSIFANELATLLSAGGNPSGMIDFLTDIWDRKEIEFMTKNRGHDKIYNPCINIIGCMTPETMSNMLYEKIISGGFTRRCLFIHEFDTELSIPRPVISQEQIDARERCLERLRQIRKLSGAFTWTDEAMEAYDDWYHENTKRKRDVQGDPVFQSYLRTKGGYVLKLAMLTTLSESDEMIMTPEHINLGINFLDQIEPGYSVVFQGAGRNELAPIGHQILQFVQTIGEPVNVKRLFKEFRADATIDEIKNVIAHLHEAGEIDHFNAIIRGTVIKFVGLPGSEVAAKEQTGKAD